MTGQASIDWPTGDKLIAWIGGTTSAFLGEIAGEIVEDVTDDMLARICTAALPSSRRPGGGAPACPGRLRRAILIDAARIYSRRASSAGIELGPEVSTRILAGDPDAERYLSTLTNWPEA